MFRRTERRNYSDVISGAIIALEAAKCDYDWGISEQDRLEKLTQDYLHSLELDGLKYKERAKLATQLAQCRKDRRVAKDTVKALEPLIAFLDSEKGRQFMNQLKDVLGKTRKAERSLENRIYCKRVLEQ